MQTSNVENMVRENVNSALEQADELLKQAAGATEEDAKLLQEKAKKCLSNARENLKDFYTKTSVEGREIAGELNEQVHDNPWKAVGIAAAAGLLVGLLVARK